MIGEPKTVNQNQALWCFPMKHTITKGGQYVIREDGSQACWDHRDVPCPLVLLAGALA